MLIHAVFLLLSVFSILSFMLLATAQLLLWQWREKAALVISFPTCSQLETNLILNSAFQSDAVRARGILHVRPILVNKIPQQDLEGTPSSSLFSPSPIQYFDIYTFILLFSTSMPTKAVCPLNLVHRQNNSQVDSELKVAIRFRHTLSIWGHRRDHASDDGEISREGGLSENTLALYVQ